MPNGDQPITPPTPTPTPTPQPGGETPAQLLARLSERDKGAYQAWLEAAVRTDAEKRAKLQSFISTARERGPAEQALDALAGVLPPSDPRYKEAAAALGAHFGRLGPQTAASEITRILANPASALEDFIVKRKTPKQLVLALVQDARSQPGADQKVWEKVEARVSEAFTGAADAEEMFDLIVLGATPWWNEFVGQAVQEVEAERKKKRLNEFDMAFRQYVLGPIAANPLLTGPNGRKHLADILAQVTGPEGIRLKELGEMYNTWYNAELAKNPAGRDTLDSIGPLGWLMAEWQTVAKLIAPGVQVGGLVATPQALASEIEISTRIAYDMAVLRADRVDSVKNELIRYEKSLREAAGKKGLDQEARDGLIEAANAVHNYTSGLVGGYRGLVDVEEPLAYVNRVLPSVVQGELIKGDSGLDAGVVTGNMDGSLTGIVGLAQQGSAERKQKTAAENLQYMQTQIESQLELEGENNTFELADALEALTQLTEHDLADLTPTQLNTRPGQAITRARIKFGPELAKRKTARETAAKQQAIRDLWASEETPDWNVDDALAALATTPTLSATQARAQARTARAQTLPTPEAVKAQAAALPKPLTDLIDAQLAEFDRALADPNLDPAVAEQLRSYRTFLSRNREAFGKQYVDTKATDPTAFLQGKFDEIAANTGAPRLTVTAKPAPVAPTTTPAKPAPVALTTTPAAPTTAPAAPTSPAAGPTLPAPAVTPGAVSPPRGPGAPPEVSKPGAVGAIARAQQATAAAAQGKAQKEKDLAFAQALTRRFGANLDLQVRARNLARANPALTPEAVMAQVEQEVGTERTGAVLGQTFPIRIPGQDGATVGSMFPGAEERLEALLKPGEGGAHRALTQAELYEALMGAKLQPVPTLTGRPAAVGQVLQSIIEEPKSKFAEGQFKTPEDIMSVIQRIAQAVAEAEEMQAGTEAEVAARGFGKVRRRR